MLLQWGHGREAMDGSAPWPRCQPACRFNGAMAVRPWMAVPPPPSETGPAQLQWGHGREAMDGRLVQMLDELWDKLQWGHGREAMDGGVRDAP